MSWLSMLVKDRAKAKPPAASVVQGQQTAATAAALNPNRRRTPAPRVPGSANALAAGTDPLGSSSTARGTGANTWLPLMNSRRPGA